MAQLSGSTLTDCHVASHDGAMASLDNKKPSTLRGHELEVSFPSPKTNKSTKKWDYFNRKYTSTPTIDFQGTFVRFPGVWSVSLLTSTTH